MGNNICQGGGGTGFLGAPVSALLWLQWGRAFHLLEARVQVSEFLLERELAAAAGRVIKITFAACPMRIFLENGAQPSRLRLGRLGTLNQRSESATFRDSEPDLGGAQNSCSG